MTPDIRPRRFNWLAFNVFVTFPLVVLAIAYLTMKNRPPFDRDKFEAEMAEKLAESNAKSKLKWPLVTPSANASISR
jgi:NADH:ubiquinone oxidoreductase subunit H